MADGKGIAITMAEASRTTGQRSSGRMTAAILARIICPERGAWSEKAARNFLRFRFADEDLNRFHGLLARHYGDTLTADEADTLETCW